MSTLDYTLYTSENNQTVKYCAPNSEIMFNYSLSLELQYLLLSNPKKSVQKNTLLR